jgi:hypothetical protein
MLLQVYKSIITKESTQEVAFTKIMEEVYSTRDIFNFSDYVEELTSVKGAKHFRRVKDLIPLVNMEEVKNDNHEGYDLYEVVLSFNFKTPKKSLLIYRDVFSSYEGVYLIKREGV